MYSFSCKWELDVRVCLTSRLEISFSEKVRHLYFYAIKGNCMLLQEEACLKNALLSQVRLGFP